MSINKIPNTYDILSFSANAGQTDFFITWPYNSKEDVFFTVNGDDAIRINQEYTIDLETNFDKKTGTVYQATLTFDNPLNENDEVIIYRKTSLEQLVNYVTNGKFSLDTLQNQSNNIFYILQDLSENYLDVTDVDKVIEFINEQIIPNLPNASKTVRGLVELATKEELDAGVDDERATTPKIVKEKIDETEESINQSVDQKINNLKNNFEQFDGGYSLENQPVGIIQRLHPSLITDKWISPLQGQSNIPSADYPDLKVLSDYTIEEKVENINFLAEQDFSYPYSGTYTINRELFFIGNDIYVLYNGTSDKKIVKFSSTSPYSPIEEKTIALNSDYDNCHLLIKDINNILILPLKPNKEIQHYDYENNTLTNTNKILYPHSLSGGAATKYIAFNYNNFINKYVIFFYNNGPISNEGLHLIVSSDAFNWVDLLIDDTSYGQRYTECNFNVLNGKTLNFDEQQNDYYIVADLDLKVHKFNILSNNSFNTSVYYNIPTPTNYFYIKQPVIKDNMLLMMYEYDENLNDSFFIRAIRDQDQGLTFDNNIQNVTQNYSYSNGYAISSYAILDQNTITFTTKPEGGGTITGDGGIFLQKNYLNSTSPFANTIIHPFQTESRIFSGIIYNDNLEQYDKIFYKINTGENNYIYGTERIGGDEFLNIPDLSFDDDLDYNRYQWALKAKK